MKHVLILGGTTEARLLAERLAGRADLDVTLSLAGRTVAPARQAVPVRSGGFGGAAGLADYLVRERVDALVDATHPYASVISAHALAAARDVGFDMPRIEKDMNSDEVKKTIDENMKLADALGVNGTPSYVVGDEVVVGAVGVDALKEKLAAEKK